MARTKFSGPHREFGAAVDVWDGLYIGGRSRNDGTVIVSNGGTLTILPFTLTNLNLTTLAGGAYAVNSNSSMVLSSATITTNGANVTLDGVGSAFAAINALSDNLGNFTITNGRTFTTAGSLSNSGTIVVGPGSALKVLNALTNTGTVDLNNLLVVDYTGTSPLGVLAAQIGTRIINSSADAAHRIGFAEASELGVTSFAGLPVDSTSAILQLTFAGDSNLDLKVDVTDLGSLATNWQTSSVWTGGDFNYDGFVDVTDLGLLATNWQAGVSDGSPLGTTSFEQALASVGLGGTNIPEPAAGALLMVLACIMPLRRRRH